MATAETNAFEIERRSILFKSTTSLPGGGTLDWDDDPNTVVNGNTSGETLIYNCPMGSKYCQDTGDEWRKKAVPNTWVLSTAASGVSTTMVVENFTLSTSDISNKYVNLDHIPNTNLELLIFIEGGTKGILNTDYFVTNNKIDWNGKIWDGLLEVDDIMNTTYWY